VRKKAGKSRRDELIYSLSPGEPMGEFPRDEYVIVKMKMKIDGGRWKTLTPVPKRRRRRAVPFA
jgi:hypothetical protein